MPQYHANSASFDLPERLKDKTVHMFTLSDEGPSEFSMVLSHADTQPGEQLRDFGTRLMSELGRALPRFQLRSMGERTLGGAPAIELAYSWRNDGHFMHQRQVIALVEGAAPGSVQAVLIAATCLQPFTDEWNAAFDQVLKSVILRRPLTSVPVALLPAEEGPAVIAPSGLPFVFAFSDRRRMLQVYASADEACRKADAREVDQQAWSFFDADGEPLAPGFAIPNAGTLWGSPGAFSLAPALEPAAPRLREHLDRVAVLNTSEAAAQFATVADIRRHLARVTGVAAD